MTTKNPAAVALGSIRTPKKAASSAANGKLGGRPVTLYDSGPMDVGGPRERVTVSRMGNGNVRVSYDTLYSDGKSYTEYYDDYPPLPDNWRAISPINDWEMTHATTWFYDLEIYHPYKRIKGYMG